MNIILMTILLTVLGMCLVALLVWLGISSYKLMKFKKKSEGSFKHLERWIDDNNNTVFNEFEKHDIENQKRFDDLENVLNNKIIEVYRTIDFNVNENQRKIDVLNSKVELEVYASLNSKIDSRCDKLHDLINK